MRTGINLHVTASDRKRLLSIIDDRNSPQKHVWRARIVLLTADGHGTTEIMRQAGVAKTAVWRWQERFMRTGVDGLLRDKTRPPRIPPLGAGIVERVVQLTLSDPPGETTHWTASASARCSASGAAMACSRTGCGGSSSRTTRASPRRSATSSAFTSIRRPMPSSSRSTRRVRSRRWTGTQPGLPLKRGVFHSIVSLQEAINRFVAEANAEPRPFRWSKAPDTIIAAVRRGHQALDSIYYRGCCGTHTLPARKQTE
jgi:hypothetical protein